MLFREQLKDQMPFFFFKYLHINTIYKIKVFKAEPSVRKESVLSSFFFFHQRKKKKSPFDPGFIMPIDRRE